MFSGPIADTCICKSDVTV